MDYRQTSFYYWSYIMDCYLSFRLKIYVWVSVRVGTDHLIIRSILFFHSLLYSAIFLAACILENGEHCFAVFYFALISLTHPTTALAWCMYSGFAIVLVFEITSLFSQPYHNSLFLASLLTGSCHQSLCYPRQALLDHHQLPKSTSETVMETYRDKK